MFREQLILKALAALKEIADECGKMPARKSLGLRFLLAYTFVATGGRAEIKWIWTDFWKHATSPRKAAPHERSMDDYIRGTGARSALNGICREIGYPTDNEFLAMLRRMADVRESDGRAADRAPPIHANDEPGDDDAA